jgi:hypothetical protein
MNEKKEETKIPGIVNKTEKVETISPVLRKLVLETDGSKIRIVENTLAGGLELKAVLTELLASMR